MLLIVALIGMLLLVVTCRRPGVPFWSFISPVNRKTKLTGPGQKLYVAFAVLLVAGTVLSLVPSVARPDPEVPTEARFRELAHQYIIAADTLAALMPTNPLAAGRLEICTLYVENGMQMWKSSNQLDRLRYGVRECKIAIHLLCDAHEKADAALCKAIRNEDVWAP